MTAAALPTSQWNLNTVSHRALTRLLISAGDRRLALSNAELQLKSKTVVLTAGQAYWNEKLSSTLKLANIPRETRVLISVSIRSKKEKGFQEAAWTRLQLYNYRGVLTQSPQSLALFTGSEVYPSESGMRLHVAFQEFANRVVFPRAIAIAPLEIERRDARESVTIGGSVLVNPSEPREVIEKLAASDPLKVLSDEKKAFLWKHREIALSHPTSLAKLALAVPFENPACVQEFHRLLAMWPLVPPSFALSVNRAIAKARNSHVSSF
jgi:hypothetical protein